MKHTMSDRRSVLKGLPRGYDFKDGKMCPTTGLGWASRPT
jgi:hypothetical protein